MKSTMILQQDNRPQICVCVVHPGKVTWDWHESVLKTIMDNRWKIVLLGAGSGVNITATRNQVHERFLKETDSDYLLWTDSDIAWTPDDLQQLLSHDLDIVSGVYYNMNEDSEIFPVFMMKPDKRGTKKLTVISSHRVDMEFVEKKLEFGEPVFEVEGTGMGFVLIKRKVIEKLGVRGHLWPFQETEQDGILFGEDITFGKRCKAAGFPPYIDLSVRVGHQKEIHF